MDDSIAIPVDVAISRDDHRSGVDRAEQGICTGQFASLLGTYFSWWKMSVFFVSR
jgi:hypothetical protein